MNEFYISTYKQVIHLKQNINIIIPKIFQFFLMYLPHLKYLLL